MGNKSHGLYPKDQSKFIVQRRDGTDAVGEKHENCRYFVLDLTHDTHAIPALRAYAASARKDGYEALANDLERIAGAEPVTTTAARAAAEEIAKYLDAFTPLSVGAEVVRIFENIIQRHFPAAGVEAGGDEARCCGCKKMTDTGLLLCPTCVDESIAESVAAALRNPEGEGK